MQGFEMKRGFPDPRLHSGGTAPTLLGSSRSRGAVSCNGQQFQEELEYKCSTSHPEAACVWLKQQCASHGTVRFHCGYTNVCLDKQPKGTAIHEFRPHNTIYERYKSADLPPLSSSSFPGTSTTASAPNSSGDSSNENFRPFLKFPSVEFSSEETGVFRNNLTVHKNKNIEKFAMLL